MADRGIIDKIKRLAYTAALTLGVMLALPGCGKKEQIEDFYTQEAEDINELTDAIENGDISKVNKFIIDTKKQEKKLAKELKEATKKQRKGKDGPDPDEINNKITVLDNQIKAAEAAIELTEGKDVPRSGFLGDAQDLVEGVADKVEEEYSDWLLREIIVESRDYANTNPEYEGIADAFEDLGATVQEITNEDFLVDKGEDVANEGQSQGSTTSGQKKSQNSIFKDGLKAITEKAGKAVDSGVQDFNEGLNQGIHDANKRMEELHEEGFSKDD